MNADARRSIEQDKAHHVHPQSNLRQHAENGPTMITHGKGVFIYDSEGREIIDGFSGLGCVSLGYHNERLASAAMRQMNTLPFAPTFYNRSHPKVAELGERLTAMAPGGMTRAMFQCSGSEANDTAIKLLWYTNTAKGEPERRKVIGRVRGYHGNTIATVSLSGQPHMHAKFGLPLPEFKHTELPNYYRFHIDGESEQEFSARMAAKFEELILSEGPETIAAFFAEPAISGGGALMPPEGYWPADAGGAAQVRISSSWPTRWSAGSGAPAIMWGSRDLGHEARHGHLRQGAVRGLLPGLGPDVQSGRHVCRHDEELRRGRRLWPRLHLCGPPGRRSGRRWKRWIFMTRSTWSAMCAR